MKFSWCTITVNNMEESLNFYQEIVGLPMHQRFSPRPDMDISFLGNGETKIELLCDKKYTNQKRGEGVSLGFEVLSAEKAVDILKKKGIETETKIIQPKPDIKFFFVRDPDGYRIQFVENIK